MSDSESSSSTFPLRYRLLFFIALLTFGPGYNYDIPSSIGAGGSSSSSSNNNKISSSPSSSNTIQHQFQVLHNVTYNNGINQGLYFMYSGPNIFGSIVAGMLIDTPAIGLRRGVMVFSIIGTIGAVLFLLGAKYVELPLLFFARLVMGFGNEAVVVSMGAFISKHWNAGKLSGMALAFGLSQATQRAAGALNFFLSPRLADSYGLEYALLGGVVANLVTVVGVISVLFLDARWSPSGAVPTETNTDINKLKNRDQQKSCMSVMKQKCIGSFCCCCVTCLEKNDDQQQQQQHRLPLKFWFLMLNCCSVYMVIFSFVGTGRNLFESVLGLSSVKASEAMSIYQVLLAFGQPLTGLIVDKIGRLSLVLLFSSAMCLIGVIYGLNLSSLGDDSSTQQDKNFGFAVLQSFIFGISFVCAASTTRASIPLIVGSPKVMGQAYGSMASLIAGSTSVMRLVTGFVLDASPSSTNNNNNTDNSSSSSSLLPSQDGFQNLFFVFLGIAIVSVVSAMMLNMIDSGFVTFECCCPMSSSMKKKYGRQLGVLLESATARKQRLAERKNLISTNKLVSSAAILSRQDENGNGNYNNYSDYLNDDASKNISASTRNTNISDANQNSQPSYYNNSSHNPTQNYGSASSKKDADNNTKTSNNNNALLRDRKIVHKQQDASRTTIISVTSVDTAVVDVFDLPPSADAEGQHESDDDQHKIFSDDEEEQQFVGRNENDDDDQVLLPTISSAQNSKNQLLAGDDNDAKPTSSGNLSNYLNENS